MRLSVAIEARSSIKAPTCHVVSGWGLFCVTQKVDKMSVCWTYDDFFSRNLGIFSAEEQEKIRHSRMAIIGCGGVGGVIALVLARSGVEHLTLVEPDCYEPSNMNRQIACFCDTIGRNKAECLRDEILRINPQAQLTVHERALTADDLPSVADMGDIIFPVMDEWPLSLTCLEAVRKVKPVVMAYPVGALSRVSVFTAASPTVAECLVMPYGFGLAKLEDYTRRPEARRLLMYYQIAGSWREDWFDEWTEGRKPHAQLAIMVWITGCLAAMEGIKLVSGKWKPVVAPYYWCITPDSARVRKFGLGRKLAARLSRHDWLLDRLPSLSRNKTLVRWFTRLID